MMKELDLYTLTDQFLTDKVVDEFASAIWTERYSAAGDCQLIVQATPENVEMLTPGTYLALRGRKDTMILESQLIEKNLLTVTGRSLITFLDQRPAWFKNPDTSSTENIADYTDNTKTPGEFLADVVNKMVINTAPIVGLPRSNANLTWDSEEIPYLSLGYIDVSGTAKRLSIPIGPLYQGLVQVAEAEGLGITLYLESASPTAGYSLKFSVYRGLDHTTGGGAALIRLAPDIDSLQDIKEIHSNKEYKNVCYVYYQGKISKHLLNPTEPEPEGLDRRVIVTNAEGEPVGRKITSAGYYDRTQMHFYPGYTYSKVGDDEIAAFREQNAKDAFAKHNYIHSVDGQSSPQNDYVFGTDYGLGSIVELKGLTGTVSKARVTEFVRTQDQTGYKEYPTISLLDKPT